MDFEGIKRLHKLLGEQEWNLWEFLIINERDLESGHLDSNE
jgi:hypothetical protein